MVPAKDESEEQPCYFIIEHLTDPTLGRPHAIILRELLDDIFQRDNADLSRLKKLMLTLVEHGQRHTIHGHGHPEKGKHLCGRQIPHTSAATKVVCRYLFPKDLVSRIDAHQRLLQKDPVRARLYKLLLVRNHPLINHSEALSAVGKFR